MIEPIIKTTFRSFTVENLKVKDRETQVVMPVVKVIVILKLNRSFFEINPLDPL